MCGRYALDPRDDFEERFGVINRLSSREARLNISPGQVVPVVVGDRVEEMKWGFGKNVINARLETVDKLYIFKEALRKRRCLVPISGFYEWKKKVPHMFKSKKERLFALAGIFDEEEKIAIVTTIPNSVVAPIHDRMPVVLTREMERVWLGQGYEQIQKQSPSGDCEIYLLHSLPVGVKALA